MTINNSKQSIIHKAARPKNSSSPQKEEDEPTIKPTDDGTTSITDGNADVAANSNVDDITHP